MSPKGIVLYFTSMHMCFEAVVQKRLRVSIEFNYFYLVNAQINKTKLCGHPFLLLPPHFVSGLFSEKLASFKSVFKIGGCLVLLTNWCSYILSALLNRY